MSYHAGNLARILSRTFDTGAFLLIALVFTVSAYSAWDSYLVYADASLSAVMRYRPSETVYELQEVLPDASAWLTVFDTDIDYPVMQGSNNLEYLNKDPFGDYSLSGSIFLDYRCDYDFTDPYSLIYGHHMEYGRMFGALDDFKDESFFEAHREGELIAGEGTLSLRLFAVSYCESSLSLIFDPPDTDVQELKQWLMENAFIYRSPEEGRIVILSTCQEASSTARLIVAGTLTG